MFGRLAREGLFGYAEYMQRLVARGEQGLSDAQVGVGSCSCFVAIY